MAKTTASDKQVAKIREWLKTQPPETQTRLGDMLEKGLIKEVKAELPAGWASKQTPAQSVPKAEGTAPAETAAPKAKSAKIKSVASNPAAKATKDAVAAEAGKAGAAAEGTAAKEVGALTKAKGLGGKLGKLAAGANVAGNLYGRGKEFYDDISTGKTVGEAINKPESNKALGQSLVDSGLIALGERAGAAVGSRFGSPIGGAVAGGLLFPALGRVAGRTLDVAVNGPKDYTKPTAAKTSGEPLVKAPAISFNEASNWLKENNLDATESNFQKAFEELNKKQQEQINKTSEPKPSADTYKPSAKESVAMAKQAVKAPIGVQDKTPEPDIMSFLNQPDTQGMLAELVARQANQVQSAGNNSGFDPYKKNKDEEDENGNPSSTTAANVRPPPRFFVNTGRFGTMAGGGSRRSPSGRLY